ncbi:MAG: hypothetical protein IT450_16325 [Phycisphaerales bacterium]|nr:hypothetical protein [Phycisphaerales bacterium]
MDAPNLPIPPPAPLRGPSEARAVAARRSLNRWQTACIILFTLVVAAGVTSAWLAVASGVVYRILEWSLTAGLSILSLPVIFSVLRWNRALGRTLIGVGLLLFFVAALIAVRNAYTWVIESAVVFCIGVLFSSILILGGLRIRKASRIIRDSDPPLAPVRFRLMRDSLVVLIIAAVGVALTYRVEDRVHDVAQIRTRRTCAENLFAIASALRDYQAIYGVRPPTLELLIGTTTLRPDSLACSVRDPNGRTVPFTYCPEAGNQLRDMVACDSADSHGPHWINILTGTGIVSRSSREKVDRYLAIARVSSIGERMAESLENGEPTIDDLKAMTAEIGDVLASLTPQQQADFKLLTQAALELAQEQEEADAEYLMAIEAFEDAGGIDEADLTSRDTIRERLELLTEARRRHDVVLKLANSTVDDLEARAGRDVIERLPRRAGREFVADATETQQLTVSIESAEAELNVLFESILQLLDQSWGQWKHDEENDTLVFEADEHTERYDAIIEEINRVMDRQNALRDQLITQIREKSQRLRGRK